MDGDIGSGFGMSDGKIRAIIGISAIFQRIYFLKNGLLIIKKKISKISLKKK